MPILIQAASSSSGQVDKGLTRGLHQNLQASTSLRTLSFYSWEKSSKRSNRKQSPIGKCVRLRRAEGIGLSPAYLISLHSSPHAPFSFHTYCFVWGGCSCRGCRTTYRSPFSVMQVPGAPQRRSSDLVTSTFTWWASVSQVSLILFLRENWFSPLQFMEILVVFGLLSLYLWASAFGTMKGFRY